MTWMTGKTPDPVKEPLEDEPQDVKAQNEGQIDPGEDLHNPDVADEVTSEWNEETVIQDAGHEGDTEMQKTDVILEPAASNQNDLLKEEEMGDLKSRWDQIQIGFVDDPQKSVEQADALLADLLKRIEQAFAEGRTSLEGRWLNHEEISTEDLRTTLQSYRAFFNRFLAI